MYINNNGNTPCAIWEKASGYTFPSKLKKQYLYEHTNSITELSRNSNLNISNISICKESFQLTAQIPNSYRKKNA